MKVKSISFGSIGVMAKENINPLFLVMLMCLIVAEVFVINHSLQTVLRFQAQGQVQVKSKGVKINFTAYDEVITKVDEADTYQPVVRQLRNPFGVN